MASTRNPVFAITSACFAQLALSKRAPWASTTPRSPAPYTSAHTTPPSAVENETSLGAAVSPVKMRAAMANFRMAERALLTRRGVEIGDPETAISTGAVSLLHVDDLAVRSHLGCPAGNRRHIEKTGFKTEPAAGERLSGPDGERIHSQIRIHYQGGGHGLLIQFPRLPAVVSLWILLFPPVPVVEDDQAIRSGRIESYVMLVREPRVWVIRFCLKVPVQSQLPKHFARPFAILVVDLHHPVLLRNRDHKIAAARNVVQSIAVQPAIGR